ncbi:helix-turn-helix domain-containing protein [Streptomyces sp. BH097]|uniref:helix-turn-helix domain-containing protein n=1 Tax=unclassified Streptomyces TaxID=2593676 RepID=UPI003BB5398D
MRPNGTRIRDLRNERGLSLRALQEQTGVHRSYLSRLETDQIKRPEPERLRAVADALAVDIGDITHQGDAVPRKRTTQVVDETALRRWTPQEVVDLQLLPFTSVRTLKAKCHARKIWHHQDNGRITFTADDIKRNNEASQVSPVAA